MNWLLIMFAMFCAFAAIACEDKPSVELEAPKADVAKEKPAEKAPVAKADAGKEGVKEALKPKGKNKEKAKKN